METASDPLAFVRQRYPELEIRGVRALDAYRSQHRVYVVNEAVVFRFPSSPAGVQALMTEKSILSRIHAMLTLPVPRPLYASSATHTPGEVFVGYHYIDGVPLTAEKLLSIRDIPRRRRLAKQLGSFLNALHAYPAEYIGVPLPEYERRADWQALYQEIREQLFARMRPDASRKIAALFEEFLGDASLAEYTPCLRHGNLEPHNVLYSDETGMISGIVDFGCAGVGDPAADLAGLLVHGEEFLDWVSLTYPYPRALHKRALFIYTLAPLREALYGLRENDPRAVDQGLEAFR
jgi:aminoglycoside 2''-phosphotransferase